MGSIPAPGLTAEQVAFYDINGYLVIHSELDAPTISTLVAETKTLLSEFPLDNHPLTKFSTGEKDPHVGDEYFLTSGDKVRFFFEEDAFSPDGKLVKAKERAINKIGHYLHGLNPHFRSITTNERNAAIARSLGFNDARCLQSMVICKQPEIGGAVPPHQDSTFLYTEPPSAVGFWYALEDATIANGCLSFAAGTHKTAPIKTRFVRVPEGGVDMANNTGSTYPKGFEPGQSVSEAEYTIGEVKAGDLVLIHGNILHKSEKNTSDKSRYIYTFHVIEGDNIYDEKNWLQPPAQGFSKLE